MSEQDRPLPAEPKITIRPEDLARASSPAFNAVGLTKAISPVSPSPPVAAPPSSRYLIGFAVAALVGIVTIVGIAVFAYWRHPADAYSSSDATTNVILRILKADTSIASESIGKVRTDPNATPSVLARAIGKYCSTAEALDLSGCPADFKVAYKQHLRAWREAQAVASALPENLLEGVFMGAINAVTRGEADGGARRLEGGVRTVFERIRTTWEDVEKTGAKYGAAL